MQSGEGSHGQKHFNVSGKVRIRDWTALDHLPSAGGPLLKASVDEIATQLRGSSLWKLPYQLLLGIVFSLSCDVQGELNLQELFLPVL